ncbi:unnamed protein product [Tilletia controversa]|uniref:DNA-directed RNA polymerase n=1 Tax=Tilletia controversa TaxID=13291 RepID=A0A8X7SYZ1_9BASI|nr:hypothetical protein CF328_g1903 [Tilletia controversa]KAE8252368.1 hypothetical protein A4X06_0g2243 [Tilletia controversa]CAD6918554.1 unnamed protein product [Tilletia controversa]CAD6919778.1 unnamed protein product [Tilletia controversa]CAD6949148.1 unnamed protein product [Tilletia controversa]
MYRTTARVSAVSASALAVAAARTTAVTGGAGRAAATLHSLGSTSTRNSSTGRSPTESHRHRSTLASSASPAIASSMASAAVGATATATSPSRSYGNSAPSVSSASVGSPSGPLPPPPASKLPSNLAPFKHKVLTRLPSPLPADVVDRLEIFRASASFEAFATTYEDRIKQQQAILDAADAAAANTSIADSDVTPDDASQPAASQHQANALADVPVNRISWAQRKQASDEFNNLARLTGATQRTSRSGISSTPAQQSASSSFRESDPFFYTQSEALFPTSRSIENLSILKACLATGMIARAEKLFDSLRHEYYLRSLTSIPQPDQRASSSRYAVNVAAPSIPPLLYDLILDCYLHKAASLAQNATADPYSSFGGSLSGKLVTSPAAAAKAAATTATIRTYVQRAWALFGMMNSQRPSFAHADPSPDASSSSQSGLSVDPTPSAGTIGIMMRGIVRLRQMGAYPRTIVMDDSSLELLSASRPQRAFSRSRVRVRDTGSDKKTALGKVENEGLFVNTYSRIPAGIIQNDCPSLDVLLVSAQKHAIALEDVFTDNIMQLRMPHAIQEEESSSGASTGAGATISETDATVSSNALPSSSALRQPTVMDVIQEASATADRMGNVSLAAQLRAQLEDEKERQLGASYANAEAGLSSAKNAHGQSQIASPEDLQASMPEVDPVLTVATNNPGAIPDEAGLVQPFNLTNLKENLSIVGQSRKMYSDPYDRQEWLEMSSIDAARKRLAHAAAQLESLGLSQAGVLQSKPLQVLMWNWFQVMQPRLQEEIARMESSTKGVAEEQNILPFIKFLPTNKLALIPILEVMRVCGSVGLHDGVRTARLLIQLGKAVEAECMSWVISQNPHLHAKMRASQIKMRQQGLLNPATRQQIEAARNSSTGESAMEQGLPKWTQGIRSRVGGFLMQILLETAKVHRSKVDEEGVLWEEDQPALYSTYQYMGGKKLGVIRLNEAIGMRMDSDQVHDTVSPRHLPMLVPPRLWETTSRGGYLTARTSLMRYKDGAEQGSYLRAASANNGLEPIMAGLDVLGQTAWAINADVFRIITELWNRGERVGKLPEKVLEDGQPERPANYETDLSQRSIYLQRMRAWALANAALHSQRCDVNYKLEIARAYLGERFYLPHNVDFRGRAYPIPPHLHHLGSDLSRGLLTFADAKPLQETGLRWLRVHLANLYGFDKASFGDRVQFALDHEEDIRKSAEDPINFRWWAHAEDPFQCLAACFELTRAAKYPDGPEAYPCSLPVHQDGTCNGLQHYAALGGDMEGARQVNLSRGDSPADVYTGVASLVIERVEADAKEGNELAQLLVGKVTRKVVKQTVMTTVYGVTMIGAKDQVMRRLQERRDVPAEKVWMTAAYLAKLIMSSIGDLFSGAQGIQTWLHETASLIAKSIPKDRIEHAIRYERDGAGKPKNRLLLEQMTSVIWQTPLGLPVVQPYRRVKKKQMTTAVQTVFIHDPLACTQVSPAKQASAFPPNFVHSLDATHMMLTALECHSAGLAFASVHDSYWTHACDIDTMSDIIRDTFVRLHSQDILGRLREEFLERYKDHYLPVVRLKAEERAKLRRTEAGESFVVQTDGEDGGAAVAEEVGAEAAVEADLLLGATPAKASKEDVEAGPGDDALADEFDGEPDAETDVDADADVTAAAEQDEGMEEADDAAASKKKKKTAAKGKGKKSSGKGEEKPLQMRTRFVELSKLIKPLPAKGTFDVSETKSSLYFFS